MKSFAFHEIITYYILCNLYVGTYNAWYIWFKITLELSNPYKWQFLIVFTITKDTQLTFIKFNIDFH